MKKNLLIILFSVVAMQIINAQNCGTEISPEESRQLDLRLENYQSLSNASNSRIANVIVDIPLKFHIFRRDDGSGGLSQTQIDDLIQQVNDFYIRSDMRFFQEGDINYVDDDETFDFNADNEGSATIGNTTINTVNVYLFNSIRLGGRPLCGYTRFPPSADRVFAVYGCVTNGATTLEHELGHYFTLYHTHGTTNTGTTDELVNQSNCQSAGDRLCDTPADPNLSGQVNNDCAYIGTAKDANGDLYMPDPGNIMSYAPESCAEGFSQQQYDRIRNGFEVGRSNLSYTSEGFIATFNASVTEVCVGESASFRADAFGASEYEWQFEGGEPATSKSSNPQVTYNTAGVYKVTLTVFNNAGQSYVAERGKYIAVSDPSINAIDGEFNSNFSNVANLNDIFEVRNPDNSLTFERNEIVIGDETFTTAFVNNFEYLSESLPQVDELSTFSFDNAGVKSYDIELDYAYNVRAVSSAFGNQIISDSLKIEVGNECSQMFETVYLNGGESLTTVSADPEIEFFPSAAEDFRKINLEYVPKGDSEFLLFKFKNISYNGNNLFIKDITITPDFSLETPSNFRFVEEEEDSLVFRWIDNSTNEVNFELQSSEAGLEFSSLATVGENSQIIKVLSSAINGNRFFRLKAVGVKGFESDYTETVEISSSVLSNETPLGRGLSIYPNPVANTLSIQSLDTDFSGYYELVSPQGAALLEGPIVDGSQIDLSSINSGIIFVRIYDSSNQFLTIKKLIKL